MWLNCSNQTNNKYRGGINKKMSEYVHTKNYIISKTDIIEMKSFGDKIRIRYGDWLKTDNQVDCPEDTVKYETTIFVYRKDIKE